MNNGEPGRESSCLPHATQNGLLWQGNSVRKASLSFFFPLPSRCKSNASPHSEALAVFSLFLLFAVRPWVTLSIWSGGKQRGCLFKPRSMSQGGPPTRTVYVSKSAHHNTYYHTHSVTVSYLQRLLKLSGKGTSGIFFFRGRKGELDPCWCFCDKMKWNIKHTVLADTKWTWLNEKPHYINYVRPLFWGKTEAHSERGNPKILVCCPVCCPWLFGARHIYRLWSTVFT